MTSAHARSRSPLRLVIPGLALTALLAVAIALLAPSQSLGIDCPPCADSNPCTIDTCDTTTGTCTHTPYSCEDGNQCTSNACDGTGGCFPPHDRNREECEDGNLCTVGEQCLQYECTAGPHYGPRNCSDGNACTSDDCDPATGCLHSPRSGGCDDGNACTGGDLCANGACQAGPPVSCDDGNPCTDDACDPAIGCRHSTNDTAACDDGRSCTMDDACHAGVCRGAGVCPCTDADADGYADCSDGCDPGATACGDCDDHRADVHPGAAEVCDHMDNDCDTSVDEGSPRTWSSASLNDPGGVSAGDGYGAAIARLGDVTGDGIDDLAIGAPSTDTPSGADAGSVIILSGADQSVHCRAIDPAGVAGDLLGTSVAALPDLTGDGVPDLVAGAPGKPASTNTPGKVTILSGADCTIVRSCSDSVQVQATSMPPVFVESYRDLGTTVASAGDVDGDGFPDILAGDPSAFNTLPGVTTANRNGRVTVFSGANCTVLSRLTPQSPVVPNMTTYLDFAQFGVGLANLGDWTGDGIDEFGVGILESAISPNSVGSVLIYSGADGSFLRRMIDTEPEARRANLGLSIGLLPDINGDGTADLALGEPGSDRGLVDSGHVVLFSGATGLILNRCLAPDAAAGDGLGRSVVIVPDLDGDGLADLAASAPYDDVGSLADAGSIALFSSADCSLLARLTDGSGARAGAHLGETALVLAGNLVGDPAGELVVGQSDNAGSVPHPVVFSAASQCFEHCAPDDPDNDPANPETCDGRDNDCDGVVDNGNPGGGMDCTTTQPGVCALGTTLCVSGSLACLPRIAPAPEVCNTLDDDCNGSTDEGDPGNGVSCATSQPGVCAAGSTHCVQGAIACTPVASPTPESCNGLDDDCNGAVDDIDLDADQVSDCSDNCPQAGNADQADADTDGLGDACDNCPTVSNPDQNPCACDAAPCGVSGIVLEYTSKGGAILRWATDVEFDITGFNVVAYEKGKRIVLTPSLVPCLECVTGRGAAYAVPIAKHKSGRSLYVEQVNTSGQAQSFGPATRIR
ncbi:MAG TPA: MopE-related protein [Candidatus Polarisedimenticolia bacterium]|jgi:hypothetical protein|nr:MopE-related protein [Candidatus Polarisedimenticolia bacterium]